MNSFATLSPVKKTGFLSIFSKNGNGKGLFKSAGGLLSCMESVQTNVLMADLNFNLIYANQRALNTLETIEDQIVNEFGVSLDEIVGGSIHRFHKDPKKIEKILRNPKALPHTAEFSFGEVTLSATINATTSPTGIISGYIVNWEDVSKINITKQAMDRVNSMMENAPVNVLFADKDSFEITYANPASITTLKTIEQYLPTPVDNIMGSSIDIFHKNPAHQRKLLADPANLPYRAQIQVGPEILDLLVSPIFDDNNTYLGPMVTWEVVTQKLKTENEVARVNSMMENAPVNVLFADKDSFQITYANPASVKTLKTIEEHLPIGVDQLLGQSIDIFHKNPALQRKILSDPNNLPHRAQIQVGPENLDLLVSAIYDKDKEYLGPMVTWELITEKLAAEKREKELSESMKSVLANVTEKSQTLAGASEELTATSQQMAGNAEETSAQANVVSAASDQVNQNIQTVATGSEEMSASIKEIAHHATQATKVTNEAVHLASATH